MVALVWERVLQRMREHLVWAKVLNDEIACLSIEYYLACAEDNVTRAKELKNNINISASPSDYHKFWEYANDLAEEIAEEELRNEQKENLD